MSRRRVKSIRECVDLVRHVRKWQQEGINCACTLPYAVDELLKVLDVDKIEREAAWFESYAKNIKSIPQFNGKSYL